jgi:hypothetical protein
MKTQVDLNQIIAELSIALKLDKSIDKIIERHGSEVVAEAMQFISFEEREFPEIEEDYEFKNANM